MAIEMAADQVVAASMILAFRMPSRVPQNRLLRQRYYVNKLGPFALREAFEKHPIPEESLVDEVPEEPRNMEAFEPARYDEGEE